MASGNLLNGGQRISVEPSELGLQSSQCEELSDTNGGSVRSRRWGPENRRGPITPDLPTDLGVRALEPNQGPNSKEKCSSVSGEPGADADGYVLSEEELLNITFDACSTTVSGEVSASTIMKYLQAMTGQDPGQDRLSDLQCLLDPEGCDPPVSRDTFHSTMREWISHCSQDGYYADDIPVSRADPSKVSINGMDFSDHEMTEMEPCYCDSKDLLSELQRAYRRLREQNSSLLKTVSQCEDTNMQLTVETTELCAKLASAQRSAARTTSLTEELEETRRALRDAQQRATHAQASCTRLSREAECLKAHIKMLEDKNEMLTLERTCSEDCVNKLRRVNAQMRAELEETLVMLSARDREITKKDFLVDKMKNSHLENHKLIEGLQSELTRLQDHSQQALLRFDRHSTSQKGLRDRTGIVSNNRSLHTEFQDIEQQHRGGLEEVNGPVYGDPSSHRTDLHHIIHRIKSAELTPLLHHHYHPDRSQDSAGYSASSMPHPYSQQQQASIKQQLANVYELELQRALWEEKEKKVAEQRRVPEPEQTQTQSLNQTPNQSLNQAPEARRAVLKWWTALRGKTTAQPNRALSETKAELLQAEQTVREMRVQVCHLEADLKTAPEGGVTGHKSPRDGVGVLHRDQETNTEREGPGQAAEEVKELRDVGVAVVEEDPGGPARRRVTAEGLLESLRRMEAMVSAALETAQLLRDGQRRVGQVQERMDSISQRVEEALARVAVTEGQMDDRVTDKPESAGHRGQTDQGSAGASSSAQTGASDRPRTSSAPAPVVQDYSTPPQPLLNVPAYSVWQEPGFSHQGRATSQLSAVGTPGGDVCVGTGGDCSSTSETVSCEDPGTPSPHEKRPCQVLLSHPEPQQSDITTGRGPPSSGFIPVSDTNTSPFSALQSPLILRSTCAPPLIVLPETPPETPPDSSTARPTEENVARSQSPASSGHGRSEPAERGSGQAYCGRSLPAKPQTGGRGLLSNPAESEKYQSLGSEHWGRSQTPETSSCASGEEADRSSQSSPAVHTSPSTGEEPPAPTPFTFPRTRSRPPLLPSMPTLPEEEEDSPEDVDSSSSSPSTCTPVVSRGVAMMKAPTIVFPKKVTVVQQDVRPMEQARPHSPRARLSRNIPSPITIVDSTGHVIDLVKDQLPELQLSEEDRQKNLELLDEAKKVSDRFLTRRGRRSTCSLSESPTGLSPTLTPSSSPVPSRSSSLTANPQIVVGPTEVNYISQPVSQRLEVPTAGEQADGPQELETTRRLVDWKPNEKRKVSSGTLTPRHAAPPPSREPSGDQKENCDPRVVKKSPVPAVVHKPEEGPGRGPIQTPATGVAKPVPRPPTQQAPCTAEIKTIGAFPPLMRAVSWDMVGTLNALNGAPSFSPKTEETFSFSDKPRDGLLKSSGYKDFPAQPVNMQKLSKLREENKLIRNQSIVGSKLPDLSESAEQERGPSPLPSGGPADEEAKENSNAMPNISDVMLRKLKLHRGLPGCAPPLTEKEVENAFVQLSLAFRNDNYTLETRLKQAERERNMTEENTEKELEEFKGSLKVTAPQWQSSEQRESYQRLIETAAVLHRLATRLSSRAEIVGAVRQEKRMNKATEVMMQYVENLKRTYEKDHAELMEFKKLANQNSNRCYGGSIDTGDDGVPRPSRSMSLTMGKALPRRRVSVAVVPKFNLLNIPGQTPVTAGPGPTLFTAVGPGAHPASTHSPGLPVLCEAVVMKASVPAEAAQPVITESGKTARMEQEGEASAAAKPPVNLEDLRAQIRSEIKAKMEEEFYSKGYQEGLKQCKDLPEVKEEEEEKMEEKTIEPEEKDEENRKQTKSSSKVGEALVILYRVCPKIFRRNRLLWIVLTLFLILFVVVNIFTYFSDRYNINHGDMSAEKAIAQNKKIFGLNVGVQPKTPATE